MLAFGLQEDFALDNLPRIGDARRRPALGAYAALAALSLGAAAAVSHGAWAQTLPKQRIGLWTSEMVMMGRTFHTKSCVDAASQAKGNALARSASDKFCKNRVITHNLDGSWTSTATCEFRPGHATTTRSDVSGDFNSKITMKMSEPPSTTPKQTMVMTYAGPCPASMKGGDVMMEDGTVMHTMTPP